MKQSTRLIVVLLLTLVWCGATLYAASTEKIAVFDSLLDTYMVITPFIILLGVTILLVTGIEVES
jgi:hypothetical protein